VIIRTKLRVQRNSLKYVHKTGFPIENRLLCKTSERLSSIRPVDLQALGGFKKFLSQKQRVHFVWDAKKEKWNGASPNHRKLFPGDSFVSKFG
jgi:hypothetical protein